ncbi:MAG: IS982 family transposase [Anaerolineae bacterium]|nr:IS982 family transposase [Anaerolineae bacterium]
MDSLLELFVHVDDFWQGFHPIWHEHLLTSGQRQRLRDSQLSESEILTILILFHQAQYRNFKAFYLGYVRRHLKAECPNLVSYKRFVTLMKRIGVPMFVYLRICMGRCTGVSFVDSTPLRVCHNRRIGRYRVFVGWAARGKTTMGWFYGFKLHLVVNDRGEIIAMQLTPGNIDDRKPLPQLIQQVYGKLFGDKGYLSQSLRDDLREQAVDLITSLRRNMQPQLMLLQDKLLLKRRSIIETINDQLKNISQIEHSRHRSVDNFFVNLVAGLIAYCHRPNKPKVQLDPKQYRMLTALH